MSAEGSSALATWYRDHIGEPTTSDEVYGYWLYVVGVLLGVLGMVLWIVGQARSPARGAGITVFAVGLLLVLAGPIVQLTLRREAAYVALLGGILSLAAVVWFQGAYPNDWVLGAGMANRVVSLYAAGVGVMALAGVVVPLVTDPSDETLTDDADSDAGDSSGTDSKATFELYEDDAGEYRWRLVHDNGNVIADGGEGYASRQKARQGLESVQQNAGGASVEEI